MKKERKVQAVTVAVLLAAAGAGLVRKTGWRPPDLRPTRAAGRLEAAAGQTPQDAVYAMLAAARAGDIATYLASATGPMEASLRQALAESSEAGFAQYLRDSNAGVKGVAVSDPERINDHQVKVRVEYVYQDRNEAQTIYLEEVSQGWRVSRTDGDERVKTLIPYGTLVKKAGGAVRSGIAP